MNVKNWWQSKTIWAAVIVVGASILKIFKIDIDADTQGMITDQAVNLAMAVSAVVSIYGRVTAKHKLV